MDLLSSTKKHIFMLIESPCIHWSLLAFYYFCDTEEEAFSPCSSFSIQSMFVKVADCVQLPSSLKKTRADLRPLKKNPF